MKLYAVFVQERIQRSQAARAVGCESGRDGQLEGIVAACWRLPGENTGQD